MRSRWRGVRAEAVAADAGIAGPGLATSAPGGKPIRVAAAQTKRRSIDWHIGDPAKVLEQVDRSLTELETLIHKAGAADARPWPFRKTPWDCSTGKGPIRTG